MAITYGVTAAGFVTKQQSVIISEIQLALQGALGVNINLLPEAVLGQIVGIFSEREALLWQLVEADYNSQYPSGAEGTSVDNILALSPGTRRLGASATKTSPAEAGIPGLVMYGTAGTVIPINSIISVFGTPTVQFKTDATYTIGNAVNAVQSILFTSAPTTGTFQLEITDPSSNLLQTVAINWNAMSNLTTLSFSGVPGSSSHFGLTLTQAGAPLTTANISTNSAYPTAGAIQTAIQALSGYSGATVGGAAGSYTITWGAIANPVVAVANNTTGATITPVNSVQAAINNLLDVTYPYTDVTVTGSFGAGMVATFGGGSVVGANPSSGHQPQSLSVLANSLFNIGTQVNISIATTTIGLKAQVTGSATCTTNGPNFVPANTLNVIGSPVSGWTSVTNPLDCITGRNIETDTQALARRTTILAENANGPLQAIIEKVSQVSGVSSASGNQNLGLAAWQVITFSAIPTTGAFTINVNGSVTGSIPFSATAATVQTAINALSGYGNAVVTGGFFGGFTINFNGSNGGQPQPLVLIPTNTLGVSATATYGLPGHAVQLIVGGDASFSDIATAIFNSKPAGIESYGTPFTTTGASSNASNQLSISGSITGITEGQSILGPGVPLGTTVVSIAGSTVTMSETANSSAAAGSFSFTDSYTVLDQFGNPYVINWQTPVEVPIYVTIHLTTDLLVNGQPNPSSVFDTGSIPTIQKDIIDIGNATPIGGTIIGFGSKGLVGAFNGVEGITFYTISFGASASPSSNANISLPPGYQALFETFNVIVSYT